MGPATAEAGPDSGSTPDQLGTNQDVPGLQLGELSGTGKNLYGTPNHTYAVGCPVKLPTSAPPDSGYPRHKVSATQSGSTTCNQVPHRLGSTLPIGTSSSSGRVKNITCPVSVNTPSNVKRAVHPSSQQ